MKAVVQRSKAASVTVDGRVVGSIDRGLVVLVCAMPEDTPEDAAFLAGKIAKLRIFNDADGKMNRSIRDTGGAVLAVSQFTLAGDWRRGNRPGFSRAAGPEKGREYYDLFCEELRKTGLTVATGEFGAHMEVALVNDGPVTMWMDTAE